MVMWFWACFLLTWLIHFWMLNQAYISEINPNWLWCVILLILCYIQFSSVGDFCIYIQKRYQPAVSLWCWVWLLYYHNTALIEWVKSVPSSIFLGHCIKKKNDINHSLNFGYNWPVTPSDFELFPPFEILKNIIRISLLFISLVRFFISTSVSCGIAWILPGICPFFLLLICFHTFVYGTSFIRLLFL